VDGFKVLLTGKAPFVQHQNLSDFLVAVPDKCRIALVADWGAHNTAEALVAAQIRATNPDICIHLGDIYYAGQDNEAEEFLQRWPMADSATGKISQHSSFAMNGNHEMFSGGHAYFRRVLGAFGQPASYFGLRNTNWQLLAFDSAYIEHRLLGPADAAKIDSRLLSQWSWLLDKIRGTAQETILLSHHQPFSAFAQENSDGKNLKQDAQNLFAAAGVAGVYGWFFGAPLHHLRRHFERIPRPIDWQRLHPACAACARAIARSGLSGLQAHEHGDRDEWRCPIRIRAADAGRIVDRYPIRQRKRQCVPLRTVDAGATGRSANVLSPLGHLLSCPFHKPAGVFKAPVELRSTVQAEARTHLACAAYASVFAESCT
jgi:Calcineurin-like phosphoesterase